PLRDGAIELRAGPTEPGDPEGWNIDTAKRRIVSRIDQLAPNLAILSPGDILPDVSLQRPAGTGIAFADWHESPPDDAPRSSWSLVLFADATAGEPETALKAAAETLAGIRTEATARSVEATPAERFWLRFRPLIVLVLNEDTSFDVAGTRPDVAGVDVLYSARPDLTIDRLPLAPIVAVGIDRGRVIGAMSSSDGANESGAEAPLDVVRFVDQLIAPASNPDE
ncbi:MAG: hypothetical protein AAFN41_04895, partial [Planctomycetota bacterium]